MSITEGTYKDFINKSINWCTKLNQAGILNNDQLNQCIANVNGTNTNILPPILDIPRTGIQYNYGIYNVNKSTLSSKINDSNTDINYITNINGGYLAINNLNHIYFINNINNKDVNQNDLNWTLLQQGDTNQYALLSPYNTYLIVNNDYSVTANGTAIGPSSLWTLTKIDNKFIAQSVLYPNYYLNFNPNLNNIELSINKNEFSSWMLYPQYQYNISSITTTSSLDDIQKQQLISNLIENKKLLSKINIYINTLQELKNIINSKYEQTLSYIENYSLNNMIDNNTKNTILTKINQSKTKILNDINTIMNNYNSNILILQTNVTNAEQQITNFLDELTSFINNSNSKFTNNNNIIERQNLTLTNTNEKINSDQIMMDNLKKKETLSKINVDMLKSYYESNKTYSYVYPIIIFILILVLIYCSYVLYDKFIRNIINQYF